MIMMEYVESKVRQKLKSTNDDYECYAFLLPDTQDKYIIAGHLIKEDIWCLSKYVYNKKDLTFISEEEILEKPYKLIFNTWIE